MENDGMAFDDATTEDKSKFVVVRRDSGYLVGPIRQMSNVHDYDEKVGCCFGLFKGSKQKNEQQNI